MRFTEINTHESHIFEKDDTKYESLFNMVEHIKRDCQPYLKQNKNALISRSLYRGVKTFDEDPLVIQKSVRLDDRQPSDIDVRLHNFFNKVFTDMFGAPFRNAIFANGSSGAVDSYGDNIYIIFPIGEFQYLWSNWIDDLYNDLLISSDDLSDPGSLSPGSELYNYLHNEFVSSYQKDEIEKAILSQHEIMIRVKSYYGIRKDVQYNLKLINKLDKVLYG